jgi:hypothetical protein
MSVAAPPRPLTSERERLSGTGKKRFLGFLNIADSSHFLKLRQCWKASEKLRIEYGVDFNVTQNTTAPWAGVQFQMSGQGPSGWALEMNTDWCVLCTPRVDLLAFTERMSVPVDMKVGKDYYNSDALHLEVGVHNVKVSLALLVLALASKKPIHVKRKEVGVYSFGMPLRLKNGQSIPYTAAQRLEVDGTLQRQGFGISVDIHQLNAMLRLRQDD